MAMNRETKRRLQRQGELGDDGAPKPGARRPAPSPNAQREPRTKPREFVREVNAEMRKVAWPTRSETINLSVIVLVFLVVLTAMIAGLDYGFSKIVLWIIDQ
ncbi:MAG: preprotein translocase subunit SecE [Acidimicrobiales bacterium]|nr:preprotein translocase subunit SecE [Acidimicrobiales bacterium]MCU1378646.1 preprotein translocase subunit SecE [Acidimicrobiales bacterium]